MDSKLKGAKLERERQKREEEKIKQSLEMLEKTRPKDTLNKQTEQEIEEAYQNIGLYMLKSSDKYVVPENERINVEKKKGHIFLVEDYIYQSKHKFNQVMLSLKSQKKHLIQKIKDYNAKIYAINEELSIEETLFEPKFDKKLEDPESQFDFDEPEKEQEEKKEKEETFISKKQADHQNFVKLKPRAAYKIKLSPLEEEHAKIKHLTLEFKK